MKTGDSMKDAAEVVSEQPRIICADSVTRSQSVQFWADVIYLNQKRPMEVAFVQRFGDGGVRLTIRPECKDEWLPQVLDLYRKLRAGCEGLPIESTHTIKWTYGHPVFRPVG